MPKRRKKKGIPGLSFSWKRATGITRAKQKISRKTGIPFTKAGRRQKAGKLLTGGGCIMYVITALLIITVIVHFVT